MRLLSFIIISSLFLCSCIQNKKAEIESKDFFKSGTVTISGQITNLSTTDSRFIFINKKNLLSGKDEVISVKIDSSGYFEKIIPLFNPQDILLDYQHRSIILLITQSDSLYLIINAQDPKQEVKISGSDGLRNTLINKYQQLSSNILTTISGKEFKQEVLLSTYNKIQTQFDSLNNDFKAKNKPDDLLTKWIDAEKKSICNMIFIDFSMMNLIRPSTILREEGIVTKKDINDSNSYCNTNYSIDMFNIYGNSILHEKQGFKNFVANIKNDNYNEAIKLLVDSIYKDFNSIGRDIILYQSFEMFSQHEFIDMLGKSPNIGLLKKYYLQYIQNEFVKSQLLSSDSESENTNNITSGLKKSPDIISELISKHKGKVLYIDIGATWCGPCIIELPFSITLYEKINNKNVVFIYLYAKSKQTDWEKISKNNVLKDENLLLSDEQYNLLLSSYKVDSSFPQYLLIDKFGNIIKNAKRPSDQGIEKDILSLLDK